MSNDVLSPFSFYGGKARMAPIICSMLDYDNTDIYLEPFGGAARVLLNKPKHKQELYNDFGAGLYAFFDAMGRPELSGQVISALFEIVPSEEIFHEMRDYKLEHESTLMEYMKEQFRRTVYECKKKYGTEELNQCHLVKGERNVCRFFQRANGQGKWNCQKESRDIFHPVSLRME